MVKGSGHIGVIQWWRMSRRREQKMNANDERETLFWGASERFCRGKRRPPERAFARKQ